jgi:hypothetical protein
LDVFFNWEQIIHDSATETVNSLTSIIEASPHENEMAWRIEVGELLKALSVATLGADNISKATFLKGVFETLNPIHYDHSERRQLEELNDECWDIFQQCQHVKSDSTKRSIINSRLALSQDLYYTDIYPGSIYFSDENNSFLESHFGIEKEDLLKGVFEPEPHIKVVAQRIKLGAIIQFATYKIYQQFVNSTIRKYSEVAIPIAVEVTPSCDFTNNKSPLVRLVPGVLISAHVKDYLVGPGAAFLWRSPSFYLEGIYNEPFILMFNSRYIISYKRNTPVHLPEPVFRLRNQYVVDIQAWFARQSARPGIVSL